MDIAIKPVRALFTAASAVLMLTGCVHAATDKGVSSITVKAGTAASKGRYKKITPEEAKRIMNSGNKYILLDVRTREEFVKKHISGAVLIPDYQVKSRAENEIADKDSVILVYCRSGHRSAAAASALVDLWYTNVFDLGGMRDWLHYSNSKKREGTR